MYVYTDDDLTRINRDYLGPKGRRLPWVATYRSYGVAAAVLVGMFGLFMMLNVPLSQWTVLLYGFSSTLVIAWIIRRMKRDVSIWAMAKAGYQEVTVPRETAPARKPHTMSLGIKRWDYDAVPAPRWWERGARREMRAPRSTPSHAAPKASARRRQRRRAEH